MYLSAEHHERPEAFRGARPGHCDGVDEVAWAVRARVRPRSDRAGEDDRRLAVVDEIAQQRGLLQGVGPVGDDDSAPAAPLLRRGARDRQRIGQGHLGARERHHGARLRPIAISCFINNIGIGIQFAAVGSAIYAEARTQGLGRKIPTDWFLESVHP